ncbi:hypothetical protein HPB52_004489 [Rhipicephalus sanguineus]|uniref:Uncharacterized protein n=1 Tax=Rhipicephalus sanguineus TaxID=34632 RepID=A0A9D4T538_RHISA|nr:hypothetical protein HPB52_004489 [Rhipicephalus sanguineus]
MTKGVDLYGAVDRFLTRLPKQYALPAPPYRPLVAGIMTGKAKAAGLNWLRQYGALKSYCHTGKLLMQADVINKGDVVISVP